MPAFCTKQLARYGFSEFFEIFVNNLLLASGDHEEIERVVGIIK